MHTRLVGSGMPYDQTCLDFLSAAMQMDEAAAIDYCGIVNNVESLVEV